MYLVSELTGAVVLNAVNRINIAGYAAQHIDADTTERGAASLVERAHRKFTEAATNIGLDLGDTSAINTSLINAALALYVASEFSRFGLPKVDGDCQDEEKQWRENYLQEACELLRSTQTGMPEATGLCEMVSGNDLPDIFTSTLYEQR